MYGSVLTLTLRGIHPRRPSGRGDGWRRNLFTFNRDDLQPLHREILVYFPQVNVGDGRP